jgi:hypothetical protein
MAGRLQALAGAVVVMSALAASAAAMTAAAAAATQRQQLLRVVTYNVRRFTAEDGTSTVADVARSLAALHPRPALVSLNEVDLAKRPDALEQISRALGGGYAIHFFGHVKGKDGFDKYGNALLAAAAMVRPARAQAAGAMEPGDGAGAAGAAAAGRWAQGGGERVYLDGGSEVPYGGGVYRIHRGLLVEHFTITVPQQLLGHGEARSARSARAGREEEEEEEVPGSGAPSEGAEVTAGGGRRRRCCCWVTSTR